MSQAETSVERNRQALIDAQQQGGSAILKTFVRLSGPGWLQSAITLGSGSHLQRRPVLPGPMR